MYVQLYCVNPKRHKPVLDSLSCNVNVNVNVNVKKTFIGGAVCREFESEAQAAEEMLIIK